MISNKFKTSKGISLITLVITIVVVIILAAAVLLSLSGNNPINNARIANLTQSKDSIESGVLAYTSKIKAKTLAGLETKDIVLDISEKQGDSYISCKSTIDGEQINLYRIDESAFKNNIDELPRTPNKDSTWYVGENGRVYLLFESIDKVPNWMKNSEDKIDNATLNQFTLVTGSAPKVAENPAEYYGKEVENYTANGMKWKIFHSDGENIYLITSDFIDVSLLPEPAEGGTKPESDYQKVAPLTNVLNGYSGGSESIKENDESYKIAKKWLKSYFVDNNYTSGENRNMQAIAYLLDTEKWSSFADGNYANYVIGGPTIEMLFASYTKKYPETNNKYLARAKNATGYEISKDGSNWSYEYVMLSMSDSLYVAQSNQMWLVSPSGADTNCIMAVRGDR